VGDQFVAVVGNALGEDPAFAKTDGVFGAAFYDGSHDWKQNGKSPQTNEKARLLIDPACFVLVE